MSTKENIKERINKASDLKASLEEKLEKAKGTPREEEFQMQIGKLNELIAHLENELNE